MSGWFESYDLSNYLPVIPDKPGILGIPDTNSKNIFGVIKRKSINIFEVGFNSLLLALDGKSVSIKEMITIDKSNI